jgi:hypothetical protein
MWSVAPVFLIGKNKKEFARLDEKGKPVNDLLR